jgi:hypothetical protein
LDVLSAAVLGARQGKGKKGWVASIPGYQCETRGMKTISNQKLSPFVSVELD